MARTLVILRHAKSSWDNASLDDHDRALAPRGRKALARIAAHLADADHPPELVRCSTARRALDTLAGVRDVLPASTQIEIDPDLYLADLDDLLAGLHTIDDTVASAMVVGHNPGLHDLAATLGRTGDQQVLTRLHTKFPTGAMATIGLEGSWADVGATLGELVDFFTPRPPR